MSEEELNIVKLGIDAKKYSFEPTDSLVDAVTKMVKDYNTAPEHDPIVSGDTVRIRIFYENPEDVPEDGYSLLDKFVYDGEKVTTPVTKTDEVQRVGDFAKITQNADKTFTSSDYILLQIASYGNAHIVRRDTSSFKHIKVEGIEGLFGTSE